MIDVELADNRQLTRGPITSLSANNIVVRMGVFRCVPLKAAKSHKR
jgi:hypothetical protein